jgi:hypothetical protein
LIGSISKDVVDGFFHGIFPVLSLPCGQGWNFAWAALPARSVALLECSDPEVNSKL